MSIYEQHFGMVHTPFSRDVPVDAMYESQAMKEAYGRICFTVDGNGFVVVTADSGCGKSTLIRKYVYSLDMSRIIPIYISDSKLTPRWLYNDMLDQLGFETYFKRGDSRKELQKQVEFIRNVAHKNVVCILDEAHLLSHECIEEFRFLLNTNYDSKSPMALILVGQTELWDSKLRLHRYAAVRQRIDMYCVLPHLTRQESDEFIQSQMDYAGCSQQVFTDAARQVIFESSGGIMRMIGRICDKSLGYACQRHLKLIDDHMVRYVVDHEMLNVEGGKTSNTAAGLKG